ncbi:hypothetical protein [Streptomyces sp. NPDC047009]|uniref:hypothetical protein n=1 Tax=Streptomyces sp. NPDC047009 TaxID=3154496 RepID=UPI0033D799D8
MKTDHSARVAALVRHNELGEEEIDRPAVLHLDRFKELAGREMTGREFDAFQHRRQHGCISLNGTGHAVIVQSCPVAASIMEAAEQV